MRTHVLTRSFTRRRTARVAQTVAPAVPVRRYGRRTAVGALTATLLLTVTGTSLAAPTPADETLAAQAPQSAVRVAGDDRYATSAEIARAVTNNGYRPSTSFVVASGEPEGGGVDALSASALAGRLAFRDGQPVPVLLVKQDSVPDVIAQTLRTITENSASRGGTDFEVYVVGGESVISEATAESLRALSSMSDRPYRFGGRDRYETAAQAAVYRDGGRMKNGHRVPTVKEVFLANGSDPADALSAGPVSYLAYKPVLLTKQGVLPDSTAMALTGLPLDEVTILGGPAVVSSEFDSSLPKGTFHTRRLAGNDRFGTNRAVNRYAINESIYAEQRGPLLANGLGFADALSAAPLAAEGSGLIQQDTVPGGTVISPKQALMLTAPEGLSSDTATFIRANPSIQGVFGVGGPAALPDETLRLANFAAR